MTEWIDIPFVQDYGAADARHDGPNAKRTRTFSSHNAFRPVLALVGQVGPINSGWLHQVVEGSSANFGIGPSHNLEIPMHSQHVDIN